MKTIVYVDGLNLYYGSLRGTVFKWLDLYSLFCSCILDGAEVEQVRYYTAPAKASSSDDPESPARQQRYLRALKAYHGERIQIVQGFIARTTPILRLAQSPSGSQATVKARVWQFTEKQSDVNLASDLISDACHARSQQAVICSNDTDLVGALHAVKRDHPDVLMGLVAPVRESRQIARALTNLTRWHKTLSTEDLARSQLPERIPGTQLCRPAQWSECTGLVNQQATPSRISPNVASTLTTKPEAAR